MTRMHSAKIIQARWCSVPALLLAAILAAAAPAPSRRAHETTRATRPGPAKPGSLAALVRAYREAPTPARRAPIEAYATAHAQETSGRLARLALGVAAYEQKDYPGAIESLKTLAAKLPAIADYPAYYLAASRVESNQFEDVIRDLAPAVRAEPLSPFAGRSWLLEARALKATDAAQAVRLLREHYAELPQPLGDLALADSYLATADLRSAADFYQRVYYENIAGDASLLAGGELMMLQQTMGAAYPQPLPQQMLRRAGRMIDAREYREARMEYQSLAGQLTGSERDLARVGVGAADYLNGNTAAAYPYLRALELPESEADAERLYYLVECARKLTDDDEIRADLQRLDQLYPKSPWRLKALVAAANRFLLQNQPDDFVPLYRAVYEDFPSDPAAATAHWKVAFQAYLAGGADAAGLLREHLRRYSESSTAPASLYFLARNAEAAQDPSSARIFYERLAKAFPNTYYGMLSRGRLVLPELRSAAQSDTAKQFLASLSLPQSPPVILDPVPATTLRIERSRLLRTAGLNDLADAELRFGARHGGQSVVLGLEMAAAADEPYQSLHIMKSMSGDYLDMPLTGAPREFWERLFPMPYRTFLLTNARAQDLDPYLLAGLIRQESEFNPQALSRANAYGLTQVRPGTGRLYARRAGLRRFTNRVLFQPAINVKIGSLIFRSMLDQHDGSLEQTLAAYNAGPNRVVEWMAWRQYREPAEFVESIPFTETREYVQAVLRNADIYRRLYRDAR